jgi:hypothetical protein
MKSLLCATALLISASIAQAAGVKSDIEATNQAFGTRGIAFGIRCPSTRGLPDAAAIDSTSERYNHAV